MSSVVVLAAGSVQCRAHKSIISLGALPQANQYKSGCETSQTVLILIARVVVVVVVAVRPQHKFNVQSISFAGPRYWSSWRQRDKPRIVHLTAWLCCVTDKKAGQAN